MKRYLLAKIIQVEDPDLGKVWTTVVAKYDVKGFSQVIPTDSNGTPLFNWGLVIVSNADLSTVLADADIVALPNIGLDTAIGAGVATQVATICANKGIPTTGLSASTTPRQILRRVGQFLDAKFDEKNFDVGV